MRQYYLRDSNNAQTGPYSEAQVRERLGSGAFGPAHTFASVERGAEPSDGDFQRLTPSALAPVLSHEDLVGTAPPTGTALRGLGGVVGVLLVVAGGLAARTQAGLDVPVLLTAIAHALAYGGLLWAAGAIVDRLGARF